MNAAVIDIGSNSVRLAVFSGGVAVKRDIRTTMLSEGLYGSGYLQPESIARTVDAIRFFVAEANKALGVGCKILPFVTAAVRQAKNGGDFLRQVYSTAAVMPQVLSEEAECEVALIGALNGKDGAVLDIGGASSELAVSSGGKKIYSFSLDTGAVKLKDMFNEDEAALRAYVLSRVKEYSACPRIQNLTAIGGTATCLGFIVSGDKIYDREKNHGRIVALTDLYATLSQMRMLSAKQRSERFNIDVKRAATVFSGGALICEILKYLGLSAYTISEADNLEGYFLLNGGTLL